MSTRYMIRLGVYGENLACYYLQQKGYKIAARNFRCHRYGEIDIIAIKNDAISFVEVKTRSSAAYGSPLEAVTPEKRARIYRTAEYYLQLNGYEDNVPRLFFDVIEILVDNGAVKSLRYYPCCF